MGPSNTALVKLYQAELALRETQSRLESVSRNVRIQERRVGEISEKLRLAQSKLKETQSAAAQLELDVKSRDAKIESLRAQQTGAKTNREYQAFLVEINTQKVDKTKTEEELLVLMESVETLQAEVAESTTSLDTENKKLESLRTEIGEKVKHLQAEIDSRKPARDAAAAAAPASFRDAFTRLADKYEGEAMSALARPDRRREAYTCTACNMDLVTDIYNKLHTRDELVVCPSCRRILFIPEDLPIEMAVNKVKEKKPPRTKTSDLKAAANRQSNAADVLNSISVEPDEPKAESDEASGDAPATGDEAPANQSST
jgi:uncharacterized protein